MTKLTVEIEREKCQGFGKCAQWAPGSFSVDGNQKVVLGDPDASDDVMLVRAAKSCPYRVITVTDAEGNRVFPPIRKQQTA